MRTRPEHEQRRFSLFVAGAITAFLALVWLITTRATLTSALAAPATPEVRGPISLIREQIGFVIGRMGDAFEGRADETLPVAE